MLIRYPGGKQKLAHWIVKWLKEESEKEGITQYREPFFGAGGIGFELLKDSQITEARINDKDIGISCLWYAVLHNLDALKKRIVDFEDEANFTPAPNGGISTHRTSEHAIAEFYKWQKELAGLKKLPSRKDRLEVAFKKLACHQLSFSGLGTVGGPIGGKDQKSNYGIGCRYSTKTLLKNAQEAYDTLSKVNLGSKEACTALDFDDIFAEDGHCIFYVDPPYYEQGPKLYQHGFDKHQHKRLADILAKEERPWLLSYDVHEKVKELYAAFKVIEVPLMYSIVWHDPEKIQEVTLKSKARTEYLISNRSLDSIEQMIAQKASKAVQLELFEKLSA
jgi:DNA adenine methylase